VSRQIKFRAYYIPERTWFSWDDLMSEFSHYDKPFEDTEDWKVMQYTGLLDRNGKEIYEGDIIGDKYFKWKITFKDGSFTGVGLDKQPRLCYFEARKGRLKHEEVLGNIYDNKELLSV